MRLGAALGLPDDRIAAGLAHVEHAGASHELDLRSMNSALWQCGWGNFLVNMIGFDGTGLTPDHVSWARDHFVNHVRSAGPFPPLRCGHQPYGVLPVTSLDLWQPRAAEPLARDTALRTLLLDLRDQVWRTHLADVPRVGARHDPPDPDADLADVMRADAQSNSYFARGVLGRHYLQHLRAFIGENLAANGFIAAQDAIASKLLARLGITWRPRLARAAYADMTWRVASPLIQNGEVSPWRMLEPNYIAALLALPTIDALIAARPDPAATDNATSLLQALLRHALLREIASRRGADRRERAGHRSRGHAARCRADRSRDRRRTVDDLAAPARADGGANHRHPDDPHVHRRADELRCAGGGGARRYAAQPRASPGARQRDAAVVDAGHARPFDASARCVDHFVRDQAPRDDARGIAEGPVRRRLRLGREPAAGTGHRAGDTARRRSGAAVREHR